MRRVGVCLRRLRNGMGGERLEEQPVIWRDDTAPQRTGHESNFHTWTNGEVVKISAEPIDGHPKTMIPSSKTLSSYSLGLRIMSRPTVSFIE